MDGLKIFLVDDDQDDWYIIEDSMVDAGFADSIRFFSSGHDLFRVLGQFDNPDHLPRLVILDLNMPKANGTEILSQLKNDVKLKDIPVIIYSTSINPLEKQKCLEIGAFDYVTKPVSSRESLEVARLFSSFLR